MPYKYIGRVTDFKGKSLWEIVGNLKNFGVGRIVTRSMLERYAEPTFMKIVKVETLQSPTTQNYDSMRKVRVWVEKTFRGQKLPNLLIIEPASYKSDYKLIPKDEEENYCRVKSVHSKSEIFPKYMELPPLLKELTLREMMTKGIKAQDLKMEVVYNPSENNAYIIAKEGERATVEYKFGIGKTAAHRLYNNIRSE